MDVMFIVAHVLTLPRYGSPGYESADSATDSAAAATDYG